MAQTREAFCIACIWRKLDSEITWENAHLPTNHHATTLHACCSCRLDRVPDGVRGPARQHRKR